MTQLNECKDILCFLIGDCVTFGFSDLPKIVAGFFDYPPPSTSVIVLPHKRPGKMAPNATAVSVLILA